MPMAAAKRDHARATFGVALVGMADILNLRIDFGTGTRGIPFV